MKWSKAYLDEVTFSFFFLSNKNNVSKSEIISQSSPNLGIHFGNFEFSLIHKRFTALSKFSWITSTNHFLKYRKPEKFTSTNLISGKWNKSRKVNNFLLVRFVEVYSPVAKMECSSNSTCSKVYLLLIVWENVTVRGWTNDIE
jgi:hypothetical protein